MPPQSRGSPIRPGFQSKSTPNLPTLHSFNQIDPINHATTFPPKTAPNGADTSPSEPASIEEEDEQIPEALLTVSSSSESDDEALEAPRPALPTRHTLGNLHSSRSQTHLHSHPSGLFPPFYNRPPTPLPPSPSLTSLLRPSFSSQNSRPTTPDSSDVEGLNGTSTPTSTAAAVAKSARTATTVPRASPKVPTYEYYGFALYLASSAAFMMYLLWAYLPSPFLHQLGIHYYPNRWWALAVPAWLVVLVLYIYVALASYNTGYLTLPMKSIENLVDAAAQVAIVDKEGNIIRHNKSKRGGGYGSGRGKPASRVHSRNNSAGSRYDLGLGMRIADGRDWKSMWSEGTDAVMDVPIGGVNEILYGAGREDEE